MSSLATHDSPAFSSSAAKPVTRPGISPEEQAVREDLAAAYRLVALHGWDDLIFTHLSVRVPGTNHFLINPYGLLFEEITASSLVKIDVDGNAVEESPYGVNPAGFVIHSALHMAREDAHCVMHLHTVQGQAVAAQQHGLLPITQTAMELTGDVAYHDFEGIATDPAERERLVADMGDKHTMILRNHGTLTVGETVSDAWMRLYVLERACEAQIAALAGGTPLNPAPEGTAEKTAAIANAGLTAVGRALAWPALRRKLDRVDPSYRD
ncbi:MAG: class II aldolase/adducin family protein [Myxococcota bacterium]|nr:class II aldolase/adducin family protein [Myxococcota bacterium]